MLENVTGLLSIESGKLFESMIGELRSIREYSVFWKVMNTAEYGIPQSRKRVFIIGIQKKYQTREWEWPSTIPCRPLTKFVDWKCRKKEILSLSKKKKLEKNPLPVNSLFVDLRYQHMNFPNSDKICPTIMANNELYNVKLQRHATVHEYLRLQGFPESFCIPVSRFQFKKQIGNSMSVNVLFYLFQHIVQTLYNE